MLTNQELSEAVRRLVVESYKTYRQMGSETGVDYHYFGRVHKGDVLDRSILVRMLPTLNVRLVGEYLEWTPSSRP